MKLALIMSVVLVLSGCTFLKGFTQMDDKWCNSHPDATSWHCWDHKKAHD